MKTSIRINHLREALVLVIALSAPAAAVAAPAHFWSHGYGAGSWDHPFAVALDATGNVMVAGSFQGSVNFGGSTLTSAGDRDIFLVKYSPSGAHAWSKRFGSTGYDEARAVAVDAAGNVVITGVFAGTVNFGGSNLVSAGNPDIFVARFNSAGAHTWSKRFGGTGYDEGLGVAIGPYSTVAITGAFEGYVDFGIQQLVSAGSQDIFVATFDAGSGYSYSSISFGAAASDRGQGIAIDPSGKILLTGVFAGTVDFGGGGLVASGYDAFVAKFNASLAHEWSMRFGDISQDAGVAVATDASGNVAVTGSFQGTVDFGGGAQTAAGGDDVFLATFDTNGSHRWSRAIGGVVYEEARGLAFDGSGNVLVTGLFQGGVDFGGGVLTSAGNADVFLARYDPDGEHGLSQRYGGLSIDWGTGVACDASDRVVLTGLYTEAVDFGGGAVPGNASADIFIARYGPGAAEPGILSISDVRADQGRRVKIHVARSGYDVGDSPAPVVLYELYRRDAAPPATAGVARGRGPELRADGWTFVGEMPAHGDVDYVAEAPTIGDSTISLGRYESSFFVRASTADPGVFFDSAPDSGHSVDNLAPPVPGGLVHGGGHLLWNDPTLEDFDYFTVYGAGSADFGAATLIDHTVMARMDVTASPYVFYFVTATDFAGNEGAPAVVNTLSGVGGTPKQYVLSVSAYPNPFNPATTIRYTVPSSGRVTVAVYDARGLPVATLVDEAHEAGGYTVRWNGRDTAGNGVASGVYFSRISHTAGVRTYKMVLLK